jgi:hypothetical protein
MKFQGLLADQPIKRSDPGFILLEKVGGGGVFVNGADLVSLNPETDQVPRDVTARRQAMERVAGAKLLRDLAFEFDAVRAVLGHGLPSFESPTWGSIRQCRPVRHEKPTPNPESNLGGNQQPVISRPASTPRSASKSLIFLSGSGYFTYIVTTRRTAAGKLLKYRNGVLLVPNYHCSARFGDSV